MASQLDLPGFVPHLLIVWSFALLIALAFMFRLGKRLGHLDRLRIVVSEYLRFGSLMTIFAIAQKAYFLGLISFSFQIFMYSVAVLASVSGALSYRALRRGEQR